jgi:hypothetical protein
MLLHIFLHDTWLATVFSDLFKEIFFFVGMVMSDGFMPELAEEDEVIYTSRMGEVGGLQEVDGV